MIAIYIVRWILGTYQEEAESISNSFHEQLILPEVFFINVKHLWVVEPADQEKGNEKTYDHVNSSQSKEACTNAEGKSDDLAAPEHKI